MKGRENKPTPPVIIIIMEFAIFLLHFSPIFYEFKDLCKIRRPISFLRHPANLFVRI